MLITIKRVFNSLLYTSDWIRKTKQIIYHMKKNFGLNSLIAPKYFYNQFQTFDKILNFSVSSRSVVATVSISANIAAVFKTYLQSCFFSNIGINFL